MRLRRAWDMAGVSGGGSEQGRATARRWLRVLAPVLVAASLLGTTPGVRASTTSATPPGAATITQVVGGEGSATVTWAAPASDGGSPITAYKVQAIPGSASHKVGGQFLTGTVTGLVNGTAYTFTVTASNAAGSGQASAPSSAATPTHPGA